MKLLMKLIPFVLPLIIILKFVNINYNHFENLDNILLGSIAISSAAMGFFIAGVSIMQTGKLSRFYKTLTDLGTDKKIMSWLMTSIGYMFLLSSISLIGLFFSSGNISGLVNILFDVWFSSIVASLVSTFFIIVIFAIVFTK